ncbi:neuropeptide F receptor-like [Lineus longissimus]|uniref:neuropeptide F receptor-like n=1 Tax=Lineus longissimus TaxID=88925 RepID=UPI00315D7F80
MMTKESVNRMLQIMFVGYGNATPTPPSARPQNYSQFRPPTKMVANFSMSEFYRIVMEEVGGKEWFPIETEMPLILIYAMLITLGITANTLIFSIIARNSRLRTARNVYILNLALSDMFMCLICMPFTLYKLLRKNWMLGDSLCKMVPGFQAVNVMTSTFTAVGIAMDRYYAIVYPTRFTCNDRLSGSISVCLFLWIFSTFISAPLFIYNEVHMAKFIEDYVEHAICMELWPNGAAKTIYTMVLMCIQFVIPVVILLVLHWKICQFLRMRMITDPKTPSELARSEKETKRVRKNTTVLVAIAIVFAMSWFPLTFINVLADFDHRILTNKRFNLVYACCHVVAMTTSTTNPIIYGWLNPNFRREFLRVVCFWYKPDEKGTDGYMENADTPNRVEYMKKTTYQTMAETKHLVSTNSTNDGSGSYKLEDEADEDPYED